MTNPDNISRFPYSGPRSAVGDGLTEAQLAERRRKFLENWAAALPRARAAVAAETQRIIARTKEGQCS